MKTPIIVAFSAIKAFGQNSISQSKHMTPQDFIHKWRTVQLKERSFYQEHFLDVCKLIGHSTPAETDKTGGSFTFEAGAGKGFANVWKQNALAKGHFRVKVHQVRRTFQDVWSFIMAKRKTIFLPGHYYHVYNRGANRQSIFREEDNYLLLLRRMKQYLAKYQITLLVYCLLPNHYHLLLRQETEKSISLLMQAIFNSYTKAYNNAYGHTGTLFEGPFHAIPVTTESHLFHLCRYIHANPVTHGLVDHPADWPYSNCLEWIGERNGSLFDPSFVNSHFPQPDAYRKFVLDYLRTRDLPEDLRHYLEG